jgi:hypothetical protein
MRLEGSIEGPYLISLASISQNVKYVNILMKEFLCPWNEAKISHISFNFLVYSSGERG